VKVDLKFRTKADSFGCLRTHGPSTWLIFLLVECPLVGFCAVALVLRRVLTPLGFTRLDAFEMSQVKNIGTGSTQPREQFEELLEWKSSGSRSRKSKVTVGGIRSADHATHTIR
jgi:hypothetical protein